MEKNTAELFLKLKKFNLTTNEARALSKIIKKIIKAHCPTISPIDEANVNFFLDYATNVPELYREHLENKRKFLAASDTLLQKGTDKKRLVAALSIFGLKLKPEKNRIKNNLKHDYEFLFNQAKRINETPNANKVIHYGTLNFEHNIRWSNLTSCKKSILRCLYQKYKNNFASEQAVLMQLRRLKVKNLP